MVSETTQIAGLRKAGIFSQLSRSSSIEERRNERFFRTSDFRVMAKGLEYPEGPVYQSDGSILHAEIHKGTLTRVSPNGSTQTVADFGVNPAGLDQPSIACGPNGAAVGPAAKAVTVLAFLWRAHSQSGF